MWFDVFFRRRVKSYMRARYRRAGVGRGEPRCRRMVVEALEDRRMLSIEILGVSSPHDDFRFIAGDDLPSVLNTYTANIDESGGTVSLVEFEMGGQTLTDNDPAGGWTAEFDMTTLTSATDLTVRAYEGAALGDTYLHSVDLLLLPDWFHDPGGDHSSGTHFDATWLGWAGGYEFDVTVNHLDLGFYTPADWVFYVPGISEPLFDLAHKRTGFTVDSSFQITSPPSGLVNTTDYQFHLLAEVLGQTAYEDTFGFSFSDTRAFEDDYGPVHVEGSVAYFAELTPHFDDDLMFDGISGNAWLDPTLTVTMPLGEARIPLLSIPGVVDVVFGASATIAFDKVDGQAHMFSVTPAITSGGLGIDTLEMNPSLSLGITGYGELDLGWGAGTAGASLTGTLEQGLTAHYDRLLGWENSALGGLTLSGDAYYETLWGFGPSGTMDLFRWDIATWDFLAGSGPSPIEQTQTHNYESGVLTNAWISPTPGPHDSLTFMVDYTNVGQPPQMRIDKHLYPICEEVLDAESTRALCYQVMNENQQQKLEDTWEVDFSIGIPNLCRFRVNVFMQRGSTSAAFRRIPYSMYTFEELGVFRVSTREAALNIMNAKLVQLANYFKFIRYGKRYSLPLRTIP